ncbi:TetR family transcriptional regulator [Rhodococcus daqingensis]|uniref:TetR family transcriptional regulator n=1 Tax=Rhodococcus daqingensis TaxID=2479363 RepID=A0ABW2RSH5_9NOCA
MSSKLPLDERRAQLLESALELADRGGIGEVTTRAVAAAAGVSTGVVHYCFEGKEQLLTAMAERLIAELSESAHRTYAAARDTPQVTGRQGLCELIRTGLAGAWATIEANPNRRLLTYEITTHALRHRAAGSPLAGAVADEQYRIIAAEATAFLDECAHRTDTAWTEPVPSVARLGLSALDGLVLRWLVDRDSDVIGRELDILAHAVADKAVETTRLTAAPERPEGADRAGW